MICNNMAMPMNLPPPLNTVIDMDFKADLALRVLTTYVVTLLFGFLGASVHVLRDINRRLDSFTMTLAVRRRYLSRIILGGVSGAFIGLFFNDGQLSMVTGVGVPAGGLISHLTGAALAFAAGFSVEVLFAILDRITQVFREFAYGADAAQSANPLAGAAPRRAKFP
jgi:hypothetical protein